MAPYQKFHESWANLPSHLTPISAAALDHIEAGLYTIGQTIDGLATNHWVQVDCDVTGTTPINGAVAAAAAQLPLVGGRRRGNLQLPPGHLLYDPGCNPGKAIAIWGHGCSGNAGEDGATHLIKSGNGTGWVVDDWSSLLGVDLDGGTTTGPVLQILGERVLARDVSTRHGETGWWFGDKDGTGRITSDFRGYNLRSYNTFGTDPHTGGAVWHDATTPDASHPNCDTGAIFGWESKGHAGNGSTVDAARGWAVYQSRVSLNGVYGWELLAAADGWQIDHDYVENNTVKDIMVRQGCADYDIGPPRWGTATGNNYVDENTTLGAEALGDLVRRPSKTNRATHSRVDSERLILSNEARTGIWDLSQSPVDGGLEVTVKATASTPRAVRWGHDAVGGRQRHVLTGDLTVTDFIHLLDFTTGPGVYAGSGSPEGVLGARVGSIYLQTDSGLWRKVTGTGSTGWAELTGAPVPVTAGAMVPINGSPSLGAVGSIHPCWLLDAAATETVSLTTQVPAGWQTFDIVALWTNAGAGTGDVVLDVIHRATALGTALTSGPAQTTTTFAAPTQDVLAVSVLAAAVPVPSASQLLAIRVGRIGTDAADTLANDIGLIEIRLVKAS